MQAILIDPFRRNISYVDISENNSMQDFYRHLHCDICEVAAYINNENDCLLVDEEGLFKETQEFFVWTGMNNPLAGYGLITGTDGDGNTVAPTITIKEVEEKVIFISRRVAVTVLNDRNVKTQMEAAILNAMRKPGSNEPYIICTPPKLDIDDQGNLICN